MYISPHFRHRCTRSTLNSCQAGLSMAYGPQSTCCMIVPTTLSLSPSQGTLQQHSRVLVIHMISPSSAFSTMYRYARASVSNGLVTYYTSSVYLERYCL